MSYTFGAFIPVPASNDPEPVSYPLAMLVPGDLITVTIVGAFPDSSDPFPALGTDIALTTQYGPLAAGEALVWNLDRVDADEPGPVTVTWLYDENPLQTPGGVWPWQIYGTDYVDPAYSLYPGLDAHLMMVPGTPLMLEVGVMNGFLPNSPIPWMARVVVTIENAARTEPPDLPDNFTPEEKQEFQDAADALKKIAGALSALGAATDPLHPGLMLANNLASQLASAIDARVGTVNSAAQSALSIAKSAIEESPGFNPIGLTLGLAAMIDRLMATILSHLANDPPDGNFQEVFDAPDWPFGAIPGASVLSNTLVQTSWAMFQDTLNMLAAAERHQGAALAGDLGSQTLQNAAFDSALTSYNAHKLTLAGVLDSYLAEIQAGIADLDLATDTSLADLQDYIEGLANPIVDDPFLAALIASIEADRPYLDPTTEGDVQQALAALLATQEDLTGSAFAAIGQAADELAGIDTVSEIPVLNGIATDSGSSATDEITNDTTPTINGTAEAGATIEVFRDGVSLGTTTADGLGQWSFSDLLAEGSYSYTAIATDLANNVSNLSVALAVVVDTTNPATPVDSNAAANSIAENTANGAAVGITAVSTDASGVVYSLSNNAGGRFAIDPNTGVVSVANASLIDFETSQHHDIEVRATDAAGNVTSQNFTITVTDVAEVNLVQGTPGADKNLLGTTGNDRIDGLAGSDTMIGLDGDDTYVVDNKSDKVIEAADNGTDLVEASVSHKLANNVENLTLTGTADVDGSGNKGNNTIVGNAGNNALRGDAGDDRIEGGGGNDAIDDSKGYDTFVFSGFFGNDTIKGFAGNGAGLGDTIEFDDAIFADFAAMMQPGVITDLGKDLLITHTNGTIKLLKVADISLLDASDFTFV